MSVRSLEPQPLWNAFADLNAVPRPSKKEERVRQFMVDFGKKLGLETLVDRIGNVIIKKPATPGMEQRTAVILQSHLDMVHQKNETTVFDFDHQGINMKVEGDWVMAEGTTLGADNGIGVAAIMALLQSTEIAHPALEAFFTIDEETGMTGAKEMDGSLLQGKILLNLDTEDDDELSIGCAGGIDTNTSYAYEETTIHSGWQVIRIKLRGLLGGHSGMDIDKGRGNANKWMARILWELHRDNPMQLISFDGGSLRNAIPREATCRIAVPDSESAIQKLERSIDQLKEEYLSLEPEHRFEIETVVSSGDALNDQDCTKILNALCAVHNGVFRMSPEIAQLVEASTSLARVIIQDGSFTTQSLQRSSVESTKAEVSMAVRAAFENMGATVEQSGDYPGWQPNRNSSILKVMEHLYTSMFHEAPQVKACHAGLECGILGKHLPGVEMISFGPNIRAAHSPDEKVQISSVQKFWSFLLETLKNIPNKA
jgi:dipeptidase D